MIAEAVNRYMSPREDTGAGWYSVAEDGSLVLHTWTIRRVSPGALPESAYMDASSLPRCPANLIR